MQMLAGLDRPTSGSVRLDGVEITDWVAGRGARRDAGR
jgi:ABC-type Fe3+/spermidine/putrescine transport system ATPase subunit